MPLAPTACPAFTEQHMGKGKHSNDTRGDQKGAQQHAEGQQGPKAHEAFLAGISDHSRRDAALDEGLRDVNALRNDPTNADVHEGKLGNPAGERDGRHPLFENRLQHDEADRAADKNRLTADVHRHHHDTEKFQIEGGRGTHPGAPHERHEAVKSTGDAGGNRSDEDRAKRDNR